MTGHGELIGEITRELSRDDNSLLLILYGSVSRREETANSDIDLLVITKSRDFRLQKRQVIRWGVTVEYVEINVDYLHNTIMAERMEIPIIRALADGVVLFDKTGAMEQLEAQAREIIDSGPPVNQRWQEERYSRKRRSDITEIYKDLLDVDDEIAFHYIVMMLLNSVIPILLENKRLWHTSKKKTMDLLKTQCGEGYRFIEILLGSGPTLQEKRAAARGLLDHAFAPHGGIVTGDALIFRIDYGQGEK